MPDPNTVSCEQFTNFLDSQEPIYDQLILKDIRPEDSWIGHIETGEWPPFDGSEHTLDRFRGVFPNVTRPWQAVSKESCVGAPCDPPSTEVGWGYDRLTYGLERKRVKTKLLCFDQIIHINKAKEHFAQIVSDIMRPTTGWVQSHYARKRAADLAGKKWVATSAGLIPVTFTWANDADGNEVLLNLSTMPTSKLTPQMLQRRVTPLRLNGYFGKQPFKDMPGLIELVTDSDTLWDLDHAVCNSDIADKWRFEQWEEQNKYWKYAYTGKIGDYVVRADGFPLRFQTSAVANQVQLVLPYVNEAATVGIGSNVNEQFDLAQVQFSYIMHRRAMVLLTQKMAPVHPDMPFATRSLGGQWKFAMDNLGQDENGCVIENIARNKGLFFADFELAAKPQFTEFMELIIHLREPACIVTCPPCNADPGYVTQNYDSANSNCVDELFFSPTVSAETDTYEVAANTITCNGVPIVHAAISEATIADVITALNADVSILGTWTAEGTTQIQLADSPCTSVVIPWLP